MDINFKFITDINLEWYPIEVFEQIVSDLIKEDYFKSSFLYYLK